MSSSPSYTLAGSASDDILQIGIGVAISVALQFNNLELGYTGAHRGRCCATHLLQSIEKFRICLGLMLI